MAKKYFVLGFFILLVNVGCSTTIKTFPLVYTHSPNTEFEILGTVYVRSAESVGYSTVLEAAKKQFPNTDFVIDIMIDQHEITTSYHWFALLFKALFSANMNQKQTRYEYTIIGTAIKYVNVSQKSNATYNNIENSKIVTDSIVNNSIGNFTIDSRESCIVEYVTGLVEQISGENKIRVKNGDILDKKTFVQLANGSKLILLYGGSRFTITGARYGTINDFVK